MEIDMIIYMVLSLDRHDQPLHNFQDPVSIFKAEQLPNHPSHTYKTCPNVNWWKLFPMIH